MRRPRPGIWIELLPVGLVLCCVAGTFALVLRMHQKVGATSRAAVTSRTRIAQTPAPALPLEPATPVRTPPPQVVVAPPPSPPRREDPTPKALARLGSLEAEQRAAARAADREAAAHESARRAAVADSERSRRRVSLVREQVADLAAQADRLEKEVDTLAAERDALARERDAEKAALARAQASEGGYAVLPHRAADGTWQRPVVIECRSGTAILQPSGKPFTMLDMSPLMGARGSPLVAAVGRELMRVQDVTSPDGAPIVPYVYFIVRPDGIRPFYEARARLEPLGIAFGYELVEQDWEIEFPDVDTWEAGGAKPRAPESTPGREFVWPSDQPGRDGLKDDRERFLWPRGQGMAAAGSLDPAGEGPSVGPEGNRPIASPGLLDEDRSPGGAGGRGGLSLEPPRGSPLVPPGPVNGTGGPPSPGATLERGSTPRPGGGSGIGGNVRPGARPGIAGTVNGRPTGSLRPVAPDGLPGLEATGGAGRSQAAGSTGPGQPAGTPSTRSGGSTEAPGTTGPDVPHTREADGTRLDPTGQGRVRIDLSELAEAAEDDEERPPLPPTGLRLPGGPSGPSSASSMLGGIGHPSRSGGAASGGIGIGTPGGAGGSPAGGTSGPEGSNVSQGTTSGAPSRGGQGVAARSNPRSVDVTLDLVVACGPDGVVLHPGGYRISLAALRREQGLKRDLETIVLNHALIDPLIHPRPRLKFLVESGGGETYAEARRQTVLSDLSWPVTFQVAGDPAPEIFPKERFQ